MLRATILAAVVATPASALSVGDCASIPDMLRVLARQHGEGPLVVLPSADGDRFTITVNPSERTWTLLGVAEGTGTACVEDFGSNLEMIDEIVGTGV